MDEVEEILSAIEFRSR